MESNRTGWTAAIRRGRLHPVPSVNLADEELQSAAMAARAARAIAETDAARNGNPDVRASFEASARRYKELADKLERARRDGGLPHPIGAA